LPATRLDTLKLAVRFLALHHDRSIRLMTEVGVAANERSECLNIDVSRRVDAT
jgi:hypothetical protein